MVDTTSSRMSGSLLVTGCRDYAIAGRNKSKSKSVVPPSRYEPLLEPTLMAGLDSKRFVEVAVSFHHVAISSAFEMYTWGRNEHGQCGEEPDKKNPDKYMPSVPRSLAGLKVHDIYFSLSLSASLSLSFSLSSECVMSKNQNESTVSTDDEWICGCIRGIVRVLLVGVYLCACTGNIRIVWKVTYALCGGFQ